MCVLFEYGSIVRLAQQIDLLYDSGIYTLRCCNESHYVKWCDTIKN